MCDGKKVVHKLGCLKIPCPKCDGKGWLVVEEKAEVKEEKKEATPEIEPKPEPEPEPEPEVKSKSVEKRIEAQKPMFELADEDGSPTKTAIDNLKENV